MSGAGCSSGNSPVEPPRPSADGSYDEQRGDVGREHRDSEREQSPGRGVHHDVVPCRVPVVPARTHGGKDAAAITRGIAGGVEHGDGVLSGDAARRLRGRPCLASPAAAQSPCHDADRAGGRGTRDAPRRTAYGVAGSAGRGSSCMDATGVAGHGRGTVRAAGHARPDPPALVLIHPPSPRRRPLLLVCGGQRRKPTRAARLPVGVGARDDAHGTGETLDRPLHDLRARLHRLRRRDGSAGASRRAHGHDRPLVRADDRSAATGALGLPRVRAVRAHAGRHAIPVERHRCRAVALDRPPLAVPDDVHRGVRARLRTDRARVGARVSCPRDPAGVVVHRHRAGPAGATPSATRCVHRRGLARARTAGGRSP